MSTFYLFLNNRCYTEVNNNIIPTGNFLSEFKFLFSKIQNNEDSALLMLHGDFRQKTNSKLISFLDKNKTKKIIFFVEDVLRLYNTSVDNNSQLTTYHIWTSPDSVRSPQIDFIVNITNQLKTEYQIFLCEYNTDVIAKNYNLNLEYYDFFSIKFINDSIPHIKKNKNQIEYKISNFNLREEPHRFLLAHALSDLKNSFVTCNWRYDRDWVLDNNNFCLSKFPDNFYNKFLKILENNQFKEILWDSSPNDIQGDVIKHNKVLSFDAVRQGNTLSIYEKSFCNIISETRFNSPWPNFTEKTIRSILACRPFILCAPVGTLSLLKQLGFKTFDSLWDESYDEIIDPYQRFIKIYNLAVSIVEKDFNTLNLMLDQIKDITEHNFDHLKHLENKMLGMTPSIFKLD